MPDTQRVIIAVRSRELMRKFTGGIGQSNPDYSQKFRSGDVVLTDEPGIGYVSVPTHLKSVFVTDILGPSEEAETTAYIRRLHLHIARPEIVLLVPYEFTQLKEDLLQIVDRVISYNPSVDHLPSELEKEIRGFLTRFPTPVYKKS